MDMQMDRDKCLDKVFGGFKLCPVSIYDIDKEIW